MPGRGNSIKQGYEVERYTSFWRKGVDLRSMNKCKDGIRWDQERSGGQTRQDQPKIKEKFCGGVSSMYTGQM